MSRNTTHAFHVVFNAIAGLSKTNLPILNDSRDRFSTNSSRVLPNSNEAASGLRHPTERVRLTLMLAAAVRREWNKLTSTSRKTFDGKTTPDRYSYKHWVRVGEIIKPISRVSTTLYSYMIWTNGTENSKIKLDIFINIRRRSVTFREILQNQKNQVR